MEPNVLLQAYLDETANAILSDNWSAYRDWISLPSVVISRSTSIVIASEEDLRKRFEGFRDLLRGEKVTEYTRLVENARVLDNDLISGSYLSHILASGRRVIPPYRSIVDLRHEGRRWRAASITNGPSGDQWPRRQLELPETREAQSVAERTEG